MAKYNIYTDGSSRGNPGAGGWGMVVMNEDDGKIIFIEHDSEDQVTNNRMELKAILCALQYAEDHPNDLFTIYSDSAYAVNSYNTWMRGWAANGWKNSKKVTVENVDLMKELYTYHLRPFFNADLKKCDGHSGDIGNELADSVATHNWKKYAELVKYWEIEDWQEDPPLDIAIQELKDTAIDWYPID